MHYVTLFLLKGETLDTVGSDDIYDIFYDNFCYGDKRPRYEYWCDWFQIGGRWCDMFNAKKGIKGERSWTNEGNDDKPNHFSIAEINDLDEKIDIEHIYAIATKSRICSKDFDSNKLEKLINQINDKRIKGVIAIIDCHN